MISIMKTPIDQLADIVFQTTTLIRKAANANDLCQLLINFAQKIGFDRIVVCNIAPSYHDDFINDIFFVHGDWGIGRSTQERKAYLLHCPITRHVYEFNEPFFWSKNLSEDPDRMTYHLIRTTTDLGDINGIQVPIFGHTGLEGAISFAGELRDLSSDFRLMVQTICICAFQELQKRQQPCLDKQLSVLTTREKEILQWSAAGRKQFEIAEILSISERTVENHLRTIRRHLGATSTAQAVARALVLGEIE